jgi:putative MATE family efflux protein
MKREYSRAKVYSRILGVAWPAIVEQVLVMTVGIVSTAFVGHIGTRELAAVGLVNMIVVFIQTVFEGLSTGGTVVIARLTGAGDFPEAKRSLVQSLYVGASAGILVAVPALAFGMPVLGLFFSGTDRSVLDVGFSYYRIVMIGTPFLVVDLIAAGAARGSGDMKTPMLVTLGVNALNVVLQSILVPRFGVTGSAAAVLLSRVAGGSTRIAVAFRKRGPMRLGRGVDYGLRPALIARIFKVGAPAFLEQFIMQGGFLALQVIIIGIGVADAAAWQVSVNVNSFAFMPVFGFAIATTTIIGQSLGRRDYKGAGIYALEANVLGVAIISAIGACAFAFARPLASIFTADPQVIALSAAVISLFACIDPFLGVMNVSAAVLRGAGDVMYVTATAFVGLWVFRIGATLILVRVAGLGLYGVMAGTALDFVVRAAMYSLRVRAGKWKGIQV